MTTNKKVEIGNIYNIGIGLGGSADCKVIRIEKATTRFDTDTAVLEMIEWGGPLQKRSVEHMETLEVVNSQKSTVAKAQARKEFAQDSKNELTETKTDVSQKSVKVLDFFHSTIGLQVSHENLKVDKLVRIDFHRTEDENKIALLAIFGHTLDRINRIKTIYVSKEEYENKPHDPYNDSVTAIWALNKCGCAA